MIEDDVYGDLSFSHARPLLPKGLDDNVLLCRASPFPQGAVARLAGLL